MSPGYIKLWRSSFDNALYFSEEFTKFQAWTDLLLLANFKPGTVNVRGILVKIERGQVLACEDFLAKRWQWSRGKVRRFLKYLESESVQQISQQKSNVCTIATVLKWNLYQSDGTADGTPNSTADGQQTDILKKDKKFKKGNKPRESCGPAAAQIHDQGLRNRILPRPEDAFPVDMSDPEEIYRADVISLACAICENVPDKEGKRGPHMGQFTKCARTLSGKYGGPPSGDKIASDILREMLLQLNSSLKAGEHLDFIPAGLLKRTETLMKKHGCKYPTPGK